jgi:histidinol phosphatase-like enzyme
MKKSAVLDRPGVIKRHATEGHCVTPSEEMEVRRGLCESVPLPHHASVFVVVVRNQMRIASGAMTTGLYSFDERMLREFEET